MASQTYNTSGYLITDNKNVIADVSYIYYNDKIYLPENTDYTVKISLDNGSHWHEISTQTEKGNWLYISQLVEQFDNKKNIKIRYDLSTADNTKTSQIDDYVIMWKLNA